MALFVDVKKCRESIMLRITQANIKQSQIALKGIGRDPCLVTVETPWSYKPLSS